MAFKDDNANPPEWVKRLEQRMQERMKAPQDPFKTNSLSTRFLYWMMLILTSCTSLLIIMHVFATHSVYLLSFLFLGMAIWGGLNYLQKKKNRVIWQAFPRSFAEYVMSRNKFFRASWHMIFTIFITGFFVIGSRFSGLEAILVPSQSAQVKKEFTKEDKVLIKQLERLTGVKVPIATSNTPASSSTSVAPKADSAKAVPPAPSKSDSSQ
ncbi:MAG: hypothetical protein V4525_03125 [Pseudomonadota bacterium]